MSLAQKSCIPCQGGVPALSQIEQEKLMAQIPADWSINGHGHLIREFKHKNFSDALVQANKIGAIAETENHHPDLTIRWGSCGVEIWTHKVNGLTESDFILAAKIEETA